MTPLTILLYPILCAAAYHLLSRATLTYPLWSRFPAWLDGYFTCAACSGTAYGAACGLLGAWQRWPLCGLPGRSFAAVLCAAAGGMVWTPLVAALHLAALQDLSRRIHALDHPQEPTP